MKSPHPELEKIEREVRQTIDFFRGLAMDAVEQEVGDGPNWQFLRSRLLKVFGHRGIEGRILEILKSELGGVNNE